MPRSARPCSTSNSLLRTSGGNIARPLKNARAWRSHDPDVFPVLYPPTDLRASDPDSFPHPALLYRPGLSRHRTSFPRLSPGHRSRPGTPLRFAPRPPYAGLVRLPVRATTAPFQQDPVDSSAPAPATAGRTGCPRPLRSAQLDSSRRLSSFAGLSAQGTLLRRRSTPASRVAAHRHGLGSRSAIAPPHGNPHRRVSRSQPGLPPPARTGGLGASRATGQTPHRAYDSGGSADSGNRGAHTGFAFTRSVRLGSWLCRFPVAAPRHTRH